MIVIDVARPYRFRGKIIRSSHLMSSLLGAEGTRELIDFAKSIGMRESWIQKRGTEQEHFDVWASKRDAAVVAGAVLIDRKRLVQIIRTKRAHLTGSSEFRLN